MCRQLHRCSVDMQISTQQPRNLKIHYVKSNISSFKSHKFWTWLENRFKPFQTICQQIVRNRFKPIGTMCNFQPCFFSNSFKWFQIVSNSSWVLRHIWVIAQVVPNRFEPFQTICQEIVRNRFKPFGAIRLIAKAVHVILSSKYNIQFNDNN